MLYNKISFKKYWLSSQKLVQNVIIQYKILKLRLKFTNLNFIIILIFSTILTIRSLMFVSYYKSKYIINDKLNIIFFASVRLQLFL